MNSCIFMGIETGVTTVQNGGDSSPDHFIVEFLEWFKEWVVIVIIVVVVVVGGVGSGGSGGADWLGLQNGEDLRQEV